MWVLGVGLSSVRERGGSQAQACSGGSWLVVLDGNKFGDSRQPELQIVSSNIRAKAQSATQEAHWPPDHQQWADQYLVHGHTD